MMHETDLASSWQRWIAKNISGETARQETAHDAVLDAIERRKTSAEIVAAAEGAARAYDLLMRQAPQMPPRDAVRPPEPTRRGAELAPSVLSGGIMDIIASDKSPNGLATLEAMKALERKHRFRSKAFFAAKHFRGEYGFRGLDSRAMLQRWALFALPLLSVALPSLAKSRGEFSTALGYVVLVGLCLVALRFLQMLTFTPWLASRATMEISKGRILITHGLLSVRQIPIEIHWIREVTTSMSLVQRMLGECTVHIDVDSPSRAVYQVHLPGPVPANDVVAFVDALRSASQKVRQGNYYAKGFIA